MPAHSTLRMLEHGGLEEILITSGVWWSPRARLAQPADPGNTVAYNTRLHTDETRHGSEPITKASMKNAALVCSTNRTPTSHADGSSARWLCTCRLRFAAMFTVMRQHYQFSFDIHFNTILPHFQPQSPTGPFPHSFNIHFNNCHPLVARTFLLRWVSVLYYYLRFGLPSWLFTPQIFH
jgi:hypothetical protein